MASPAHTFPGRRLETALAVIALVAAACLLAVAFPFGPDRVTPEDCGRITPGMRLNEVLGILGRPPDESKFWGLWGHRWWGRSGFIAVVMNSDDDTVVKADYVPCPPEPLPRRILRKVVGL